MNVRSNTCDLCCKNIVTDNQVNNTICYLSFLLVLERIICNVASQVSNNTTEKEHQIEFNQNNENIKIFNV